MAAFLSPDSPCRILVVTSAKGGVGKTTVCANLAACFAKAGKRTLAIDLDLTNRCLDLVMGTADLTVHHVLDVLDGVPPEQAIVQDPRFETLHFLAAPRGGLQNLPSAGQLTELLRRLAQSGSYDLILADTPGSFGASLYGAAASADLCAVVTTEQQTAIRSAQLTGQLLREAGAARSCLIVNSFRRGKSAANRMAVMERLIDTIDEVSLPLLGVIPMDTMVWQLQNNGILVTDRTCNRSAFTEAFNHIMRRLCGENVPLRRGVFR